MDIPCFPASNFYRILFLLIWDISWEESSLCITNRQIHFMPILNASHEGFQIPTVPLWSLYHAKTHHPMPASLGRVVESETGWDWKGPWRSPSSNPPCCRQGHIPLDQVVQSFIQPGPENSRDGTATVSLATWSSVSSPSHQRVSSLYLIQTSLLSVWSHCPLSYHYMPF